MKVQPLTQVFVFYIQLNQNLIAQPHKTLHFCPEEVLPDVIFSQTYFLVDYYFVPAQTYILHEQNLTVVACLLALKSIVFNSSPFFPLLTHLFIHLF